MSANSAGAYAGLRLDLPNFDLRVGGRQTYSFQRSYQLPKAEYDHFSQGESALLDSDFTEPGASLALGASEALDGAALNLIHSAGRKLIHPAS